MQEIVCFIAWILCSLQEKKKIRVKPALVTTYIKQ